MYNLPHFKENDASQLLDFMRNHPFAMLIGSYKDIPVATQVPFLIEQHGDQTFLKGHIMRQTDHHRALEQNNHVLCLFSGAHTYVSASLYKNPQVGSTWNYMSVQAQGRLRFLPEEALIDVLRDTTTHFENNPASRASFSNLPDAYIQKLVKAIVGFEIEIAHLDGVFKLSQNQDAESYTNVINALKDGGADAKKIGGEMAERKAGLFGDQ